MNLKDAAFAALYRLLNRPSDFGSLEEYCRLVSVGACAAFGRRNIQTRLSVDNVDLTPYQTARIGFIVVELVTNIMKHTPDAGRAGAIWIDLEVKNTVAELTVSDSFGTIKSNDIPTPPRIVEALAHTLSGHAFIVDRGGYAVTVQMPLRSDIDISPLVTTMAGTRPEIQN
jgi:two-component sensor histidine kinase